MEPKILQLSKLFQLINLLSTSFSYLHRLWFLYYNQDMTEELYPMWVHYKVRRMHSCLCAVNVSVEGWRWIPSKFAASFETLQIAFIKVWFNVVGDFLNISLEFGFFFLLLHVLLRSTKSNSKTQHVVRKSGKWGTNVTNGTHDLHQLVNVANLSSGLSWGVSSCGLSMFVGQNENAKVYLSQNSCLHNVYVWYGTSTETRLIRIA